MTLDETIQRELEAAMSHAEEGNAGAMNTYLEFAKFHARKARRDISAQVVPIEKTGYRKAVPRELENAILYFEQGRLVEMENHLGLAIIYAGRAGQNISAKIARVARDVVRFELEAARVYAERGYHFDRDRHLKLAETYAGRARQDISAQVAEVRALVQK